MIHINRVLACILVSMAFIQTLKDGNLLTAAY